MIDNKFTIPSFDGDRSAFQLWKSKLLMLLDIQNLQQFVIGSKIESESEDHMQRAKKAKSIICLALTDDILCSVIHFDTAKDVFDHLCAQYENNGRGSRVRAWRNFWAISKGSDTIKTYIAKIQRAAQTVTVSGGSVESQVVIDKIF